MSGSWWEKNRYLRSLDDQFCDLDRGFRALEADQAKVRPNRRTQRQDGARTSHIDDKQLALSLDHHLAQVAEVGCRCNPVTEANR